MFEGLFGADDDDPSQWESSPQAVSSRRCAGKTPTPPRAHAVPFIGLANQGATCYLNSLLHALYFTPEFRKGLYALKDEDLVVTEKGSEEENETSSLAPADAAQLELLLGMGFPEELVKRALKRFSSADDATCEQKMEWMLSAAASAPDDVIPPFNGDYADDDDSAMAMMMMGDDDEVDVAQKDVLESNQESAQKTSSFAPPAAHSAPPPPETETTTNTEAQEGAKKKVRQVPQALQRLFGELALGDVAYASTEPLTQSFGWSSSHTSVQHDVQELSRVLMDVVERSLRGTSQTQLIRHVFHGAQCHQIKCKQCGTVKEREEEFGDLTLAIPKSYAQTSGGQGARHSAHTNSLENCMAHYFGIEMLEGTNQYDCDVCAAKSDAEIGMRLKRLPRVLCLSLARMEYDFANGQRIKNTGKVTFPPSLDVTPFLADEQVLFSRSSNPADSTHDQLFQQEQTQEFSSPIYDLYAVIVHKGATATSGHYHVFVKDLYNLSNNDSKNAFTSTEDDDADDDEYDEKSSANAKGSSKHKNAAGKQNQKKNKGGNAKANEDGREWKATEAKADAERLFLDSSAALLDNGQSTTSTSSQGQCESSSIWYDFDDTRVKRIDASQIPKVFASSECAYMFFYKQREFDVSGEVQSTTLQTDTKDLKGEGSTSTQSAPTRLNIPPHLLDHVKSFNDHLQEEREVFEKKQNELDIELLFPHHLFTSAPPQTMENINKGVFFNSHTEASHDAFVLGGGGSFQSLKSLHDEIAQSRLSIPNLESSLDAASISQLESRTVVFDQRQSVNSLLAQLKPFCEAQPQLFTHNGIIRFDMLRSYHDKVLVEKRFAVDAKTWTFLREIEAGSDMTSKTFDTSTTKLGGDGVTVKSLDMAKKQRVLIWNGSNFDCRIATNQKLSLSSIPSKVQPQSGTQSSTEPTDDEKQEQPTSTSTASTARSTSSPSTESQYQLIQRQFQGDESRLPFSMDTSWSTISIRVFHASPIGTDANFKIGDSQLLYNLFRDSDQTAHSWNSETAEVSRGTPTSSTTAEPTFSCWNDLFMGLLTLSTLNEESSSVTEKAGDASSKSTAYCSSFSLKLPPNLPIERIPKVLSRSALWRAFTTSTTALASNPSLPSILLLQPHLEPSSLGSLAPSQVLFDAPSLNASTIEQACDDASSRSMPSDSPLTISSLEQMVESRKEHWWKRRMQDEDAEEQAAVSPFSPPLLLIDDSQRTILGFSMEGSSSIAAEQFRRDMQKSYESNVLGTTSESSDAGVEDESTYDQSTTQDDSAHDDSQTTASTATSSSKRSKKKEFNLYVILALKLPKSSFHFLKKNTVPSSSSNQLTLYEPLPSDDDSSKSENTSSSTSSSTLPALSYHPRYVIQGVGEQWTMRQLLGAIWTQTGLAQPPRLPLHARLYSVDAFEQRDRLYDQLNVSVKNAGLSAYCTLWLEEGSEPVPGLLQLSSHLFRLNPNPSPSALASPSLEQKTQTETTTAIARAFTTPIISSIRPNLLFIPLSLDIKNEEMRLAFGVSEQEKATQETKVSESSTTATDANTTTPTSPIDSSIPLPPPPPPLPPKSTFFALETSSNASLGSLKDQIAANIESQVLTCWHSACGSKSMVPPTLSELYRVYPFDFFRASDTASKRASMAIWLDDLLLIDNSGVHEGSQADELPLKTWRLNSWQRGRLAICLLQSQPFPTSDSEKESQRTPLDNIEIHALTETNEEQEKRLKWRSNSGPSLLTLSHSPTFSSPPPLQRQTLLFFFRKRIQLGSHGILESLKPTNASNSPSFGPLHACWVNTIASQGAAAQGGKKGGGNAKQHQKKKDKTSQSSELADSSTKSSEQQRQGDSHTHNLSNASVAHVMIDLDLLVGAFSSSSIASSSPVSEQIGTIVDGVSKSNVDIPAEWLLLAKIGMAPHNHDMATPKWQLLWKPSAYLQEQETTGNVAIEKKSAEGADAKVEVTSEAKTDAEPSTSTPVEKEVTFEASSNRGDLFEDNLPPRHEILLRHLSDPKVPSAHSPHSASAPSSSSTASQKSNRKVKLNSGDVLVFADARDWHPDSHDDVFWDNQRRIGAGRDSEQEYLSDLERALIESTKTANKSKSREVALTIDVDW